MWLPSTNLKFHGPIIKIRHHWFLLCWLMMLIGQQKLATAFAPRLSRTALPTFQRPLPRFPLQATAKKKSTSGSAKRKPYSLVVHGPTADFSVKKISKRPFKLVIVESPSKCQTIAKILQQYVSDQNLDHDYVVTSCMGHIRNIPQKKTHKNETIAGIDLEPQEGDPTRYRPTYTILPEKEQLVEDLKALSDRAQQLVLATDDDREGEAMAWHLLQVLLEEEGGGDAKHAHQMSPLRVRFTEITPKAIVQSIQNPETSLNTNLVKAQETRRILDRLAGFTVSPILWKKIAPGLSAGRVQSVGMALIVQRERERLLFKETEFWDGQADFSALSDQFQGTLVSISGTQLASGGNDFDPREANTLTESSRHKLHLKRDDAEDLFQRLNQNKEDWEWTVANITATQRKLNPSPPFITSTLQQEANKRLGLSVSRSMQTAQQLYEKGFISYMRTDSNHLSDDAKAAIKTEISKDYGGPDFYQPTTAKAKRKKKKSGKPEPQAAHEAIRPAIQDNGRFTKPSNLPDTFDGAAKQLYELIYQRTVASHMPPQVSNQTAIRIIGENEDTQLLFRTSGSVVIKPGFSNVYPRQAEKDSPLLPSLREGQKIDCNEATPLIHITQAPARYTEASFVQELEALGVGRPSTYAGTVQILRDRAYVGSPVTSDSARSGPGKVVSGPAISAQRAAGGEEFTGSQSARGPLVPSLTAFVVCSLLETQCSMYVDPSFTAGMEERLDKIANAEENISEDERVAYLDEFYAGDNGLAAQIERIHDSDDADDARRAKLPALEWNSTNGEEIGLFVGPWGPYVKKVRREESGDGKKPVSAPLPAGMAADLSIITLQNLKGVLATKEAGGTVLGQHPDDGRNIRLMVGRFGAYLQLGEDGEDGTTTHTLPRSVRNMKNIDVEQAAEGDGSLNSMLGITFEEAVQYANLPRTVCEMNELPILAAIGPYGPYLKYNSTFLTLKPADGDVLTIEPESAQILVTEGIVNRKSSKC
jgi:DNA topoisomerase-1